MTHLTEQPNAKRTVPTTNRENAAHRERQQLQAMILEMIEMINHDLVVAIEFD